MKKKVLAAIIIAASLLAGCGEEEEQASSPGLLQTITPEPIVTVEPEPTVTEEPEVAEEDLGEINGLKLGGENHPITERTIVNGQMQSYLTGEWKDADVVQRRNMAVMIPNNNLSSPTKGTVPQHGISYASIIYEAPVEGRITRLMAFFEDYDDLNKIGPVRSSRDYYVYESMAYDSIYCNWGLAVPFVEDLLKSDRVDNVSQAVSGIHNPAPEAFANQANGLNPGYAQEFTSCMTISGYEKAVARLGYDTTYEEHGRFEQAFTFADEGYIAGYVDYPDATVIYPGGTESNKGGYGSSTGSNAIRFEYNEEDGLYYRYQYGAPHVDADNGEQLAVTNVVFKVCHGEQKVPGDSHDYLGFGVHGSGTAYVFTNGKVIEGTWQRNSDYEANIFYDADGNEIVFNQGKTWICCIWEEYSEYMKWE